MGRPFLHAVGWREDGDGVRPWRNPGVSFIAEIGFADEAVARSERVLSFGPISRKIDAQVRPRNAGFGLERTCATRRVIYPPPHGLDIPNKFHGPR